MSTENCKYPKMFPLYYYHRKVFEYSEFFNF